MGTLTNGVTGTLTNTGVLNQTGTLNNLGIFNQNGGRFTTDQLFTGGTFNFNGGTLEITDAGQALTVGASEFSLTNGAAFNTSAGTTTLGSNQHLEIAGAATVDSGATLTMSGGSLTSGSFTNNGTVHTTSGTSIIAGDVQNDGVLDLENADEMSATNKLIIGYRYSPKNLNSLKVQANLSNQCRVTGLPIFEDHLPRWLF